MDLKNLYMYAPTDFVGVMNSAVDLRGPDEKLIDRRKVKLEWVEPKKPIDKPMSLVPPPPAASVAGASNCGFNAAGHECRGGRIFVAARSRTT